jgi:hypothetical protein
MLLGASSICALRGCKSSLFFFVPERADSGGLGLVCASLALILWLPVRAARESYMRYVVGGALAAAVCRREGIN